MMARVFAVRQAVAVDFQFETDIHAPLPDYDGASTRIVVITPPPWIEAGVLCVGCFPRCR